MPKVSIIMPSLNVAPYIRECMDSVVCQTLQDIEILCVDAGSTDGTWEILEDYARKDSRIRLIKSEKKSYGYQMNLGLKAAEGEYIGIVETDDFILPTMYEALYAYAKDRDADFVKSDFDLFVTLDDGVRAFLRFSLERQNRIKYDMVYTSKDFTDRKETIDVFIWNGIYKKDFLADSHIMFQETPGAAFQDCGFRYQVVLNVKRGFFIKQSFYRYRRDNINSSTYNSKCVLFNLAECKNLLRVAERTGKTDRGQMEFLAREIAVIAHRPYIELLMWGRPAEGTKEALDEFRLILKDFMQRGILSRMSVTENEWLDVRIFAENPDFYDYYAHLKAEIASDTIRGKLRLISEKKQIVLFGSGQIGSCAYCMFRINGLQNIVAFCDNDRSKWGTLHIGCMIMPPEEAVKRYPDAYYIITTAGHADEIRRQLTGYGVNEQQVAVYCLSRWPMECTNMVMSLSDS